MRVLLHFIRNICQSFINGLFSGHHFWSVKRLLLKIAGVKLGKNVRVVGPVYFTCKLTIGDNTFIGRGFEAHGNGSVVIGSNCDLAPNVMFLTGSHEIGSPQRRAGEGKSFDIIIEDGCWLGARSTVMGNTVVGKGSIIASCALVNKNVDENTIVGGVPAKIIRELE